MHRLRFFVLPLLVLQRRDLKGALIWSGVVFVTVMLHELGHALALRAFGFAAAITLHGLGGTTSSPSARHSTPRQDFFISLAGPGAGLVSGLPVLAAQAVVSVPNPDIALVMSDWVWVSVGWSLVNLLPILPWDGGNLFAAGLEWGTGKPHNRLVALSSIVVGLLVVASALSMSEPLLGYFGVMGLVFGYQRWGRVPSEDELKQELEALRRGPGPQSCPREPRLQRGQQAVRRRSVRPGARGVHQRPRPDRQWCACVQRSLLPLQTGPLRGGSHRFARSEEAGLRRTREAPYRGRSRSGPRTP